MSELIPGERFDHLHEKFALWLEKAKMREHLFDVVAAIIIGLLCGFAAVGFRMLIGWFRIAFWGDAHGELEVMAAMPSWRIVIAPAVGGLLVGPIVYFFAKEARGHGVPEVMAAVAVRNGVIRARVSVAKIFASALTIASGGSAGREGPIIQIGSAIGSLIGQFLAVSRARLRTFVGCGAAGGIAATFNAPIAGALFSIEVILREFGMSHLSPIIISAVMATVVSHQYFGDGSVFQVPEFEFVSMYELVPYLLLALACGLVSCAFIRTLWFSEDRFEGSPIPMWLQPAVGGLMLGLLGLSMGYLVEGGQPAHIFGDGAETINLSLLDSFPMQLLLLLLVAKMAATCLTLGSGGSGGVFAPSLFLGAVTGAVIGKLAVLLFGLDEGLVGAFALVGMAGVVAGTTHAPITAVLIIFEITNSYSLILPLMMVSIVSILISSGISKESIYTMKLVRRGLNIFSERPRDVLREHMVRDCLREDLEEVRPETPTRELIHRLVEENHTHFYVIDDDGNYQGMVHIEQVRTILHGQQGLENVLLAEDLAEPTLVVYPDETLSQAFQKFERSELPELPVVERGEHPKLLGCIHYHAVLTRYNAEMLRLDSPSTMAGRVVTSNRRQKVKIVEGYSMIDWEPPSIFWGRSIRDAQLGSRYHVQVILVKKHANLGSHTPVVPTGNYVIHEDDVLVIYGADADLERARKL